MFRDLEKMQTSSTASPRTGLFGANLAFGGQTMTGAGVLVSGNYFPLLGLQPALGRLLNSNDDQKIGESPVVVLSHAYWTSRFGQRADVVNQQMIVNGQSLTIVGVAPAKFEGTTLGTHSGSLRADHAARPDGARVRRLGKPPQLLGLRVRAAEAGRADRAGAAPGSTCSIAASSTTSKRRCSAG